MATPHRGVVFQTLEESGCRGMLDALLGACAELEKARTEKREEQSMLQAKRQQIEQFAETTVSIHSSRIQCWGDLEPGATSKQRVPDKFSITRALNSL